MKTLISKPYFDPIKFMKIGKYLRNNEKNSEELCICFGNYFYVKFVPPIYFVFRQWLFAPNNKHSQWNELHSGDGSSHSHSLFLSLALLHTQIHTHTHKTHTHSHKTHTLTHTHKTHTHSHTLTHTHTHSHTLTHTHTHSHTHTLSLSLTNTHTHTPFKHTLTHSTHILNSVLYSHQAQLANSSCILFYLLNTLFFINMDMALWISLAILKSFKRTFLA